VDESAFADVRLPDLSSPSEALALIRGAISHDRAGIALAADGDGAANDARHNRAPGASSKGEIHE
jgi:hypothetical protein